MGVGSVLDPLRVATIAPEVCSTDLAATVGSHAASVRAARADLVVFPELSLTGYHLGAAPVGLSNPALVPLVEACAATQAVALVGAPVVRGDEHYIATLRVDGQAVGIAYRKCHLGDDESRVFRPGPGPVVIDVAGWRVGLAICKDTGVPAHTRALAAAGIDLYACGVVHHSDQRAEQRHRARRVAGICRVPVAMASFAGCTGGGYVRTAGHSAIWAADGELLVEAGLSLVIWRSRH